MPPVQDGSTALVTALLPVFGALALAIARPMGVVLILPVFTRVQIGGAARGSFAFVLSLSAAPAIYQSLVARPPVVPLLALLGVKEMLIGLMIGLLAGIPIWCVQVAGELLDTQRSATQGQVSEPTTNNQDSLTSTLLAMTAIALFVSGGGLDLVAQALANSEALWPPMTLALHPRPGFGDAVLGLLDQIEIVSLKLAAPVVLAMLLCDACVILLMRAIPKLHLYDLAPTLRNLAYVVMMFAYASWLVVYARRDMRLVGHALDGLQDFLSR